MKDAIEDMFKAEDNAKPLSTRKSSSCSRRRASSLPAGPSPSTQRTEHPAVEPAEDLLRSRLFAQPALARPRKLQQMLDLGQLRQLRIDFHQRIGNRQPSGRESCKPLNAACSSDTPLRSRPTLLMVRVCPGLPSTSMNGGTSCTTFEQPPMIDILPMRQN